MKKTTYMVGLFLGVLLFVSISYAPVTHASNQVQATKLLGNTSWRNNVTAGVNKKPRTKKQLTEKTAPSHKKPVEHIVAEGETLTIIAANHASTWMRLFAKNSQIADPNIIEVGEKIAIPGPEEELPDRPLPAAPQPEPTSLATQPQNQSNAGYTPHYGDSAGNTYSPGYCTWYAKNRRPDLPNSLGNADTWVYRAQALGLATGSTPRVGAIGQQGMHVVYVESVNGDGTVTISEMNYVDLYITSSRTVPAGSFMYIY
jgi:surface antigen